MRIKVRVGHASAEDVPCGRHAREEKFPSYYGSALATTELASVGAITDGYSAGLIGILLFQFSAAGTARG